MDINKLTKPYFLFNVDYCGCLGYFSADNCFYGCEDDTLELEGYEDTPFVLPGIESWCDDWDVAAHKEVFEGVKNAMDWDDWNRRGLAFAQMLRQLAPVDIEIVYRKGQEYILLDKIKYFALCPDCVWCIGDTNECSETLDVNDILEVAYFKPMHIPGIGQWYDDFDRRADYAYSTADPSFDWASWTAKGWEFARIIRANLPMSVEVWYRNPFELREIFPVKDLRVNLDGTFTIDDFLKEA